jgi:hypothetical protein
MPTRRREKKKKKKKQPRRGCRADHQTTEKTDSTYTCPGDIRDDGISKSPGLILHTPYLRTTKLRIPVVHAQYLYPGCMAACRMPYPGTLVLTGPAAVLNQEASFLESTRTRDEC